MKCLYDFITKANQVMLFVAVLALLGLAAYRIIAECLRDEWTGPQVAIAQTTDDSRKVKIEDIRVLGLREGYYVFGVIKGMIEARQEPEGDLYSAASKITGSGGGSPEMVNVLFVARGNPVRPLLASDGLVLQNDLASRRPNEDFRFHRFTCVTEDTNGDHVLDRKDRQDLHVVDLDLKRPDWVLKDIGYVEVVSPTVLLLKKADASGMIHFYEVDCEARTQTEILWK